MAFKKQSSHFGLNYTSNPLSKYMSWLMKIYVFFPFEHIFGVKESWYILSLQN